MTKYRAWDKENNQMWYGGFFIQGDTGDVWVDSEDGLVELNQDMFVLMQFTGLKDKNGKEIYGEGDIYKDADGIISVVKMAVDGWALFPVKKGTPVRSLYWHNVCDKTKGEVISNINEHPQLLEER